MGVEQSKEVAVDSTKTTSDLNEKMRLGHHGMMVVGAGVVVVGAAALYLYSKKK